jgi:ankyrin repeat protein
LSLLDPQTHRLKPAFSLPHPLVDWIDGHEAFVAWKTDPSIGILCISGPPGSGTTALALQVLGVLLDQHEQSSQQSQIVLTFSFNKNNIRAKSPFSLYLSLCRQLLSWRPQLFRRISAVSSFLTSNGVFTTEAFWVLYRSLLTHLLDQDESVYFVIDAIDDCTAFESEVVKRMEELVRLGNGRFKLLFSRSDGLNATTIDSGQCRDISLGEFAQEDFAWGGLADLALAQLDAMPAQPPYLLANLNMLLLEWTATHTRENIKLKLQEQPADLAGCYRWAMAAIKDDDRKWVSTALEWIIHAVRPLKPTELAVAVALQEHSESHAGVGIARDLTDLGDKIRVDIIGHLRHSMPLFIKVVDNRLYLIHHTFRAFLLESTHDHYHHHISTGDEHHCMFSRCLEYLKSVGQRASKSVDSQVDTCNQGFLPADREFGLLSYACLHWPEHFHRTNSKAAARDQLLQFLHNESQVKLWANLYHHLKPSIGRSGMRLDSALKIVCHFGLTELVDDCILRAKECGNFQEQMRESLDLAAQIGHVEVVQKLIREGSRSTEALSLAASGGFEKVIQILLDVEDSVDSAVSRLDQIGFTPLHHATCGGHKSVVLLLLDKKADPNARTSAPQSKSQKPEPTKPATRRVNNPDSDTNNSGSSPLEAEASMFSGSETCLHLAALTGQAEIAKILIERGAEAHAESAAGYDAFKYAALGGFFDLLPTLVQHMANTTKAAKDGNTALHLAADHGYIGAVKDLLQTASNAAELIHKTNSQGLSPIHVAAREGHLSVLEFMLSVEERKMIKKQPPRAAPRSVRYVIIRSETPTLPNASRRKSALEWAAQNGHGHVVSALLERNARSDQGDRAHALNMAAKEGHTDIVKILLDRGNLQAAVTDTQRNTPLHLAVEEGYAETLVQLFTHPVGAAITNTNSRNEKGMTPLHVAAKAGSLQMVEILIQYKSPTHIGDETGRTDQCGNTALHHAATNGHLAVARRLYTQSRDTLWMQNSNHHTAFDLVVMRGKIAEVEEFIQILEESKASAPGDYVRGGLPLHAAARGKSEEIFGLLIDRGWMCDTRDAEGNTPLHIAVTENFQAGIILLLQNKNQLCDVNATNSNGNTPLHYARNPELIAILLDAKAKNDEGNKKGQTPLYFAAYDGLPEVVEALLNSTPQPDPNVVDDDGWSPLHVAYDSLPITELLLAKNAEPNTLDNCGLTPLVLATEHKYSQTVTALLKAGADPNMGGEFAFLPLSLAVRLSGLDMVKIIVEAGADLLAKNANGYTALHEAAGKGDKAVVQYLLGKLQGHHVVVDANAIGTGTGISIRDLQASMLSECVLASTFDPGVAEILVGQHGVDVNQTVDPYFTALQVACAKGTFGAVKWLLEKGANVNVRGGPYGTALCAAVESDRDAEQKVRLLVEKGADVNLFKAGQPTALQRVASMGKGLSTLLDLLLLSGADVNLVGAGHDTPLNEAISQGFSLATIINILNGCADACASGRQGRAPIHIAAAGNRADVLQVLISAGVDPLSRDANGQTTLMYGLLKCNTTVVDYLLDKNAFDACEVDAKQQTPLMVAAVLGDKAIVGALLEKDSFKNPEVLNARDFQGRTALAHAAALGHLEIVRNFIKSGADASIADHRGCGPLYWAVRLASFSRQDTMNAIAAGLDSREGNITTTNTIHTQWNVAVHGAVASESWHALRWLLGKVQVDVNNRGADGWTPLYTAQRYKAQRYDFSRIEHTLSSLTSSLPVHPLAPSGWHPHDKFPCLVLGPEGRNSLTVIGN